MVCNQVFAYVIRRTSFLEGSAIFAFLTVSELTNPNKLRAGVIKSNHCNKV